MLRRLMMAQAADGGAGVLTPPGPVVLDFDPYYQSNTILLQGDGAAAGTRIVDHAGGLWTVQGNAQTDGSGAIVYDGSGDAIYVQRGSVVGVGDFTIERKVHITSLASDGEIFCISSIGRGLSNFDIVFEVKTTGAVRGSIQNGSGTVNVDISSAAGTVVAGNDYHLCFEAEGTTARLRKDGVVIATGTISGTRVNTQPEARIGELAASSGFARYFNGKDYWTRVATVCRYPGSGSITPPSDPIPTAPVPTFSTGGFTTAGVSDAQGVATDGTHVWFSNSSTIYKYTTAGSLVTSRNVMSDAPTGKTQINGMLIHDGILYVSAAENSTPRKAYIVKYDPDTLAYIGHGQITGDWFSEGITERDGFLWVCFHANKEVAQIDMTTFAVVATYSLSFPITGSSGGFGAGTGYDGIAWVGDYLFCNIHEIYDQKYLDVYAWNGAGFDEVIRQRRPTSSCSQGIAYDAANNIMWFAERNGVSDGVVKSLVT